MGGRLSHTKSNSGLFFKALAADAKPRHGSPPFLSIFGTYYTYVQPGAMGFTNRFRGLNEFVLHESKVPQVTKLRNSPRGGAICLSGIILEQQHVSEGPF